MFNFLATDLPTYQLIKYLACEIYVQLFYILKNIFLLGVWCSFHLLADIQHSALSLQ